jgi:type IX secretion system PorP/SprF family membrane protein
MNILSSALVLKHYRVKTKDSTPNISGFFQVRFRKVSFYLLFIGVLMLSSFPSLAQDDPQYSQNMYNRLPVNPGYAGSTGAMCATSLLRNQWVGFEGAPRSVNLAFDALVEPVHGGLGFAITQDRLGLTSSLGAKVAYAYRMRVSNSGRLAFGLAAGFLQKTLDLSNVRVNGQDPLLEQGSRTARGVDFDFGAYYNTSDYYLGASVTHLNQSKLDYFDNIRITVNRHFYFMGGYNYALNRTITLKPSFFVKSDATSTQADVNLTLLYNNTIWGGVSYRIDDSVILMAGMNITNDLKFGYSYDITTSAISIASSGSHELMLRYCFKIKNNKDVYMNRNPRFL